MAVRNRNEAITQVNTLIVPQVTTTIHRNLLNNNVLNSIVFRKDVIGSITPAAGVVTADFTNFDLLTMVATGAVTVTVSGMENGDIKYLAVEKPSSDAITFNAATNLTPFLKIINEQRTEAIYQIMNKNGILYVRALDNTIIEASATDIKNADEYRIPTAKAVSLYVNGSTFVPVITEVFNSATVTVYNNVAYRIGKALFLQFYISLSGAGLILPTLQFNIDATGTLNQSITIKTGSSTVFALVTQENPLQMVIPDIVNDPGTVQGQGVLLLS